MVELLTEAASGEGPDRVGKTMKFHFHQVVCEITQRQADRLT